MAIMKDDRQPTNDAAEPQREALVRKMEACRRYLLSIAARRLEPDLIAKGGASDIVQDTYLEAHRDIDRFCGETDGQVRAWLRQILHHNVINFARRYHAGKRVVGQEVSLDRPGDSDQRPYLFPSEDPTPSAEAIRNEEAVLVNQALARLAEKDRQILVWRNIENLSFETIAERIDGNPSQARKAWLRAIERLRGVLESLPHAPIASSPSAAEEPGIEPD